MAMKKCKECGEEISSSAKKCPKCGKDQRNFFMKHPVLYTILILIVIGVVGGSGSDTTNTSTLSTSTGDTTATTTTETPEVIEYTAIDVDALNDALENNAAAAKDTYNKKYLEITGRLSNIDSDLSYISIGSTTDEWDFMTIQCFIKDQATKDIVKSLSKDDTIVVRGQITDVGEVLGYTLNITEIVK